MYRCLLGSPRRGYWLGDNYGQDTAAGIAGFAGIADIVNHIADGVYVVDKDRRISLWNKAAERITGFTAEEVEGRSCAQSLLTHTDCSGKSLCKADCPLAITLVDGEVRQAVVNLHHKSGHRIPVHVDISPVRNEQGQVIGAVETFRECSDVIRHAQRD